jgi:hypothetical protein
LHKAKLSEKDELFQPLVAIPLLNAIQIRGIFLAAVNVKAAADKTVVLLIFQLLPITQLLQAVKLLLIIQLLADSPAAAKNTAPEDHQDTADNTAALQ